MVMLPSGLEVGLDRSAMFDPGPGAPPCAPGRYWRMTADPMIPKPYRPDQYLGLALETCPVPRTRKAALAHVRVVYIFEQNYCYWRGEYADQFPLFDRLDAADLVAWWAFLAEDRVQRWLDGVIETCARLSAALESRAREANAASARDGPPWTWTIPGPPTPD